MVGSMRILVLVLALLAVGCSPRIEAYTWDDIVYLQGREVFTENGRYTKTFPTRKQAREEFTEITINSAKMMPRHIEEVLRNSLIQGRDTLNMEVEYMYYPKWALHIQYTKRTEYPVWFMTGSTILWRAH